MPSSTISDPRPLRMPEVSILPAPPAFPARGKTPRRFSLLSIGCVLLSTACAGEGSTARVTEQDGPSATPQDVLRSSPEAPEVERSDGSERQRGVSWVASRDTVLPSDFHALAERGVNWVVQTPFGWQRDPTPPKCVAYVGTEAGGESATRVWSARRSTHARPESEPC